MAAKKVSRLKFVIAGDSKKCIEERHGASAWRALADNGFIKRTSVSSVGFHRDISNDTLLVVLPKVFDTLEVRTQLEDPLFQLKQIYQLIRLFRAKATDNFCDNRRKTNKLLERTAPIDDPVLNSFEAALKLRRDYREHGLYRKNQ